MEIQLDNQYRYFCELRGSPEIASMPLASEDATLSLGELIDETYHRGVLADRFPAEPETIRATIRPIWSQEPLVSQVQVELSATNGKAASYSLEFDCGPWVRRAQLKALLLKEEGSLAANQKAYRALVAVRAGAGARVTVPPLQPPAIVDGCLEDFGI
ncbi:MAG: hypothetical protein HUU20_14805, partial [Pirellulales bacterium]|nr:hypothetical protein [Pirellulales bacterium]